MNVTHVIYDKSHKQSINTINYQIIPTILLFNTTPTSYIYTLSLHDALPIYSQTGSHRQYVHPTKKGRVTVAGKPNTDRKSTRLNSSHLGISYAVFCLKKKKNN